VCLGLLIVAGELHLGVLQLVSLCSARSAAILARYKMVADPAYTNMARFQTSFGDWMCACFVFLWATRCDVSLCILPSTKNHLPIVTSSSFPNVYDNCDVFDIAGVSDCCVFTSIFGFCLYTGLGIGF
jgi:hypothetical protein